ncbi:MAG: bifunctional precorrin-2 dehydrogenase/sirohydrochlorin ferrochelatase [Desulfobacterales bacterium]|nr:bifunctional precorrin-2 dehydrogenase/sirohydrochlorin ferrochelatase [Desulfobacterales bacterium]
MRYYPVNLDINKKNCLVVGGGPVGTRKVKMLLDCGAKVTLVSPFATEKLAKMADNRKIIWHKRSYEASDLEGTFLVIGATDDEALNVQISLDAEKLNKLCNIADRPEVCNFILPAIVQKDDLIIAISTSGQSPAFAKNLRKELEKQFGDEYAVFLKIMGAIRKKLLSEKHEPEAHKPIFEKLIHSNLLEYIRSKDLKAINTELYRLLGNGYRFEDLFSADENPL